MDWQYDTCQTQESERMMNELAPGPSQRGLPQHGLVSLWDMFEARPSRFVTIGRMLQAVEKIMSSAEGLEVSQENRDLWRSVIFDLKKALGSPDAEIDVIHELLPQSAAMMERYTSNMNQYDVHELRVRFSVLSELIISELRSHRLFVLLPHEAQFWPGKAPPFGTRAYNAFPSARFDIDEACKCLALERSTAAVLHLMRALEKPLKLMATELEIDAEENWNRLLDKIEQRVRGKDDKWDRTEFWKGRKEEQEFYAEAVNQFFFFKNSWRNSSTHGRTEKYLPHEAETILKSVQAFLDHLGKRLSESEPSS